MNPKQLFIHSVLLIAVVAGISSCKPKPKDNPCGDPPVAEAPVMRFIDKQTGKDYIIQYPDMRDKLVIKSFCNRIVPQAVYFYPLNKGNTTYGYVITYNYLPLPMANESSTCRSYTWTWDGTDEDTLTYFTHNDIKECYTLAVLDSIHYNGVKIEQVTDTNSATKQAYYTVIK